MKRLACSERNEADKWCFSQGKNIEGKEESVNAQFFFVKYLQNMLFFFFPG